MSDYDKEVQKIRGYNQPILDDFRKWLEAANLAVKTIETHVLNMDFFSEYLAYYPPLSKLDETQPSDIYDFLADWFPRKVMWASPYNTKSHIASFRKFFKFLVEKGRLNPEMEKQIKETLKENKQVFLDAVEFDDDTCWF